jgi:hypothetical protein
MYELLPKLLRNEDNNNNNNNNNFENWSLINCNDSTIN